MMITPGAAATAGFLAVVGWVCVAVVWAAWVVGGRQWAVRAAVGVGLVLAVSAGLAEGGVVRRLAESRAILLFLWTWLGVAVGVAFSRAVYEVVAGYLAGRPAVETEAFFWQNAQKAYRLAL